MKQLFRLSYNPGCFFYNRYSNNNGTVSSGSIGLCQFIAIYLSLCLVSGEVAGQTCPTTIVYNSVQTICNGNTYDLRFVLRASEAVPYFGGYISIIPSDGVLTLDCQGPIPDPCNSQSVYDPDCMLCQCGCDGNTYALGKAYCAGVTVAQSTYCNGLVNVAYTLNGIPVGTQATLNITVVVADPADIQNTQTTCEYSIELPMPPPLNIPATINAPGSVCPNQTATFTASAVAGATAYTWNTPPGANITNGQGTASVVVNWGNAGAGNVCVTASGNCRLSPQKCKAVALSNSSVASFSQTVNGLAANFTNASLNSNTYHWDFGDGQTSMEFNPNHTYATSGTYSVCLTATGSCGSVQQCQSVSVAGGGGSNGPGLPAGDCWTWQNPLPQGNILRDIFFIDFLTGWAVGDFGRILKTIDGGNMWNAQTSGTTEDLLAVHFIDNQNGWAVGYNGLILKSIDGGNSWIAQISGTINWLNDVNFLDTQIGWVVGGDGIILKTTDGGNSWIEQNSGTINGLYSVYAISALVGWAVGYDGVILKTINGGASWTVLTSGTTRWLYSVYFNDIQTGWAVGEQGTILKTNNGGNNWTIEPSGVSYDLYDIFFIDTQTGVAVGDLGTTIKTSNGGASWTPQNLGTNYNRLHSVFFPNAQSGFAVGDGGIIIKTNNGGANWVYQQSYGLSALSFPNEQTGWAVGANGAIMKTTNGGNNWIPQYSGTIANLFSVQFLDIQTGWAVGWDGTILKTTNSGLNWITQSAGTTNWLWSVYFTDAQIGWVVGENGIILKTTDGGINWMPQNSGTSSDLYDVQFVNTQTGWAAGANGIILKTTDGGINWMPQNSGTIKNLRSIYLIDLQIGWAVGDGGTILKTTNGGSIWSSQNSGTTKPLTSVYFTHAQNGWVAGILGITLKTTNSGIKWETQNPETFNGLNSVCFANPQTGWVAGDWGTILRYTPAIPSCISAIPLHQQTNIADTVKITWPEAAGCEDGYHLTLSTTPGGSNLLDSLDVGNVTTYQPAQPLPPGQTIYVRITPYNTLGTATGCQEFSFTTAGVSGGADTIPPCIEWQRCLGGGQVDNGNFVYPTIDGGYVAAGMSFSNDGDVSGNHGNRDFWIVKLNSSGNIQWQKSIGGSGIDDALSVIQTSDGGYIAVGGTTSNDGDVTGNHGGNNDVWVTKLSSTGNLEWQKALGGSGSDIGRHVILTQDNGYLIAGGTDSNDGDVSGNHGNWDFWLVKLNSAGGVEWSKTLGGTNFDNARFVEPASDGGYIVVGETRSNDNDVSGNHGVHDFWVVKIDNLGNIQWQKTLGGSTNDLAYSVKQTADNNFIVAGWSDSNNGDVTNNHGDYDFWVVKLSETGNLIWQKSLGGSTLDAANSLSLSQTDQIIVTGQTTSNDGDVTGNNGFTDYWVVALDQSGKLLWQKTFGGSSNDKAHCVQYTSDQKMVIIGYTTSNDGDVSNNHGGWDYWLLKLKTCPPPPCTLVTTPADSGPGSLRAAIDCANANPGPDTIRFNIPGAGPHIIAPLTTLPIISDDNLVIDATTQPGWAAGNIVLDGTSQAGQSPALNVNRWNDTLSGFELYGLTIRNFADRALTLSQVRNIVIGAPGKGNTFYANAFNPQFYAHHIALQDCSNGKFQDNIVGLKEDYSIPAGSSADLAGLAGELRDFLIGGDRAADEGNVFGNCYHAINLWDNPGAFVAGNIRVFGNDIGRSPAGADAGATNHSILVGAIGSGGVRIGDGTPGRSNRIEYNLSAIFVSPGGSADISYNRFACNDFGINAPQAAPLISAAGPFSIAGTAAAGSRVEVYRHQTCGSAECQGSDYLGTATANAGGLWMLPAPYATTLNPGDQVTATGTLNNGTSGFALCRTVSNNPCTLVTTTADAGPGSLRAAIACANANPGPDTIRFNIPGAGPHIIAVLSQMTVSDSNTVIDAATQPGWAPGAVILDGSGIPVANPILFAGWWSDGFEIYGLTFRNSPEGGLKVQRCTGVKIGAPGKGNIFYSNGRLDPPYNGTNVGASSSSNLQIWGCTDVVIQGNNIGFTENNSIPANKTVWGITASGENIRIGGLRSLGEGNAIGNHLYAGLSFWTDSQIPLVAKNIQLYGNTIGTDASATLDAGNDIGITLSTGIENLKIGGNLADQDNIIRNNHFGVTMYTSVQYSRNAYICNDSNIVCPCVTPRPQLLQLASADVMRGTALPGDTVEVFISDNSTCPGAPCQGSVFLGKTLANAAGKWTLNAPFEASLNGTEQITATATRNGMTWGFAPCLALQDANGCDPLADSLALVALFNATSVGPGWTAKTNWKTPGASIDTWYGIQTNAFGCVTCIDLDGVPDCAGQQGAGNKLTGTLPATIGDFSNLTYLSLGNNLLSGFIPADLGRLSQLEILYLQNNNFEGPLPSELGDLTRLKGLSVRDNKNLSGAVPQSFQQLDSLELFYCHNNVIDSLPNLSALPFAADIGPSTSGLRVFNNRLTFDDVLPNIGLANTATFVYAPQDSVFADTLIIRNAGDPLSIDLGFDAGVPDNLYAWYKGPSGWTPPAGNSPNSNKLNFTKLKLQDAAIYHVKVTNPRAPDLTLRSRAIRIVVNADCSGLGINTNATAQICSVAPDGTALAAPSGASTPFHYLWNTGDTLAAIKNLSAGAYTVTVTDDLGCTTTGTCVVADSAATGLLVNPASTAVTCPGGNNGTAQISILSGTTPYQIQWSNGKTSANISGLVPGVYSVSVTDANGCHHETSVTVPGPQPILIALTASPATCIQPDGSIQLNISGGNGGFSYLWNNMANTPNLPNLPAGVYTVTATDAKGCTASNTATVDAVNSLTAGAVVSPDVCDQASGSINLTITGGAAPLSIDWLDLPGLNNPQNRQNLPAGIYTATITDAKGCTTTSSGTVTAEPGPLLSPATTPEDCDQSSGSITLTVNGGKAPFTYDWQDIPGPNNPQNRQNLTAAIYFVTVTDANGCSTAGSATVDSTAIPVASASGTPAGCSQSAGTIQLTVTGGTPPFTYDWQDLPGTNDPANRFNLPAGTYTVKVTDLNGCTAIVSSTVEPTGIPAPTTAQHQPVSLQGTSDGAGIVYLSGGTPPFSIAWNGPSGGNTSGQTAGSVLIQNLVVGPYSVTVTDANGCTGTAAFTIEKQTCATVPVAAIQAENLPCTGSDLQLRETGGHAISWVWSGPNGFNSTDQNPVVPALSGLASGSYQVVVTDSGGCSATAVKNITVLAAPVAQATANPAGPCEGDDLQLRDEGTGGSTWKWDGPDGFVSSQRNPLIQQVSSQKAGIYSVVVTHTNGCTDTAAVEVQIFNSYAIEIPASICAGESYSFCGNVYTKPGTYYCDTTTMHGCDSLVTLLLSVFQLPGLITAGDTVTIPSGTMEFAIPVTLNDAVPPAGQWEFTIITNPAAGSIAIKDTVLVYQLNQTGFSGLDSFVYRICSTVCADVCDSALVRLFIPNDEDKDIKRDLANVLTPGMTDQINDIFDPVDAFEKNNYLVSKAKLSIFNRAGMLIFQAESDRPMWDGSLTNGLMAPQAAYYFKIEAEVGASKPKVIWGIITVLR